MKKRHSRKMKEKEKSTWGGKRVGAGRPSICHNKKKVLLTISHTTLELVDRYAAALNMSRSDLMDVFLSENLEKLWKDRIDEK